MPISIRRVAQLVLRRLAHQCFSVANIFRQNRANTEIGLFIVGKYWCQKISLITHQAHIFALSGF